MSACAPTAAPPGYDGPVPTGRGQTLLSQLAGERVTIAAFGPGEWEIGGFAVIPHSGGSKGPVLVVSQGDQQRYVPIESDADAADLYRRVHGAAPEGFDAVLSDRYRALW